MSDEDEVLLEELRLVVNEVDGVPEGVLVGARAAFALRPLHSRLAELTFDSWAEPAGAAGLRSSADRHRHLAFAAEGLTVAFAIDVRARRIVGQVSPGRRLRVELRNPAWSTESESDEHGRFALDGVPAGPASILLSSPDGEIVATEWLAL